MLQNGPMNGAEIMSSMEAMSSGWWRPSAGSVYPMLEAMTQEGLIKRLEGGRYTLTTQGKEEIDWPHHMKSEPKSVEDITKLIASYVSYLEDISTTDKDKVSAQAEKLKDLSARISRVAGD